MKSQEKKWKIDFTGWEIKLTVLNSTVSTKPGHEAYMYCGVCNNGFAALVDVWVNMLSVLFMS